MCRQLGSGSVYFGGYRMTTTQREVEPAITLSAGPVGVYPRVLRAMSRPVQYDFDPYFQEFYEIVNRKVSEALRIDYPALILHCEPAPGIEAAAASLISKNDIFHVETLSSSDSTALQPQSRPGPELRSHYLRFRYLHLFGVRISMPSL